jgi:hypothetical protein
MIRKKRSAAGRDSGKLSRLACVCKQFGVRALVDSGNLAATIGEPPSLIGGLNR